jgi:S1-C subfamily serine protease
VAQKAGVKVGDKILRIGAMDIVRDNQISRALRSGGSKVAVKVERKGEAVALEATFPTSR